MGEGGEHVSKERLQKMLESLDQKQIDDACKKLKILDDVRNIIREDIDKLLKKEDVETETTPMPNSRSRSMSTLTEPSIIDEEPAKEQRTPKEYVHEAWVYVQTIRSISDPVVKNTLKIILETMETEPIKQACETDTSLKYTCDAIHNKIRDLTGNWSIAKRGAISGGKRTRRTKTIQKKRRSSRKNKK